MANNEKFPTVLVVITVILVLLFLGLTIKQLVTGAFLFLSDGGWKWLLVVGGLGLFVLLMMAINRN